MPRNWSKWPPKGQKLPYLVFRVFGTTNPHLKNWHIFLNFARIAFKLENSLGRVTTKLLRPFRAKYLLGFKIYRGSSVVISLCGPTKDSSVWAFFTFKNSYKKKLSRYINIIWHKHHNDYEEGFDQKFLKSKNI